MQNYLQTLICIFLYLTQRTIKIKSCTLILPHQTTKFETLLFQTNSYSLKSQYILDGLTLTNPPHLHKNLYFGKKRSLQLV